MSKTTDVAGAATTRALGDEDGGQRPVGGLLLDGTNFTRALGNRAAMVQWLSSVVANVSEIISVT